VPSNSKRVVVVHRAVKQHNVHAESSDSRPNVGIGSNSEVEQDDNELLEHDAWAGNMSVLFHLSGMLAKKPQTLQM